MFITLTELLYTREQKAPQELQLRINAQYLIFYLATGRDTRVELSTSTIRVKETPEQIDKLLGTLPPYKFPKQ